MFEESFVSRYGVPLLALGTLQEVLGLCRRARPRSWVVVGRFYQRVDDVLIPPQSTLVVAVAHDHAVTVLTVHGLKKKMEMRLSTGWTNCNFLESSPSRTNVGMMMIGKIKTTFRTLVRIRASESAEDLVIEREYGIFHVESTMHTMSS